MAGTVITDAVQAASTSQLVIKNGVALTPPTINDVNGTQIGTFCRAWVNFNGTGTVAIRASFNVSSITDGGTGAYTVNFTTALVDNNYTAVVTGRRTDGGGPATGDTNITSAVAGSASLTYSSAVTTSAVKVVTGTANPAGSGVDADCFVAIFR